MKERPGTSTAMSEHPGAGSVHLPYLLRMTGKQKSNKVSKTPLPGIEIRRGFVRFIRVVFINVVHFIKRVFWENLKSNKVSKPAVRNLAPGAGFVRFIRFLFNNVVRFIIFKWLRGK